MTELQTKTRQIKELILQSEEDRKNIIILQESLDKLNEKIKMYKRQLEEQEGISNANIMRVKKFQRELECAENRAEEAESTLNQIREIHRHPGNRSCCQEDHQQSQHWRFLLRCRHIQLHHGLFLCPSDFQRLPCRLNLQQSWFRWRCQGWLRS